MGMRAPAVLATLLMVATGPSFGQDVTIPQEYGKVIKSAEVVGSLGVDLFGDATNLFTGTTEFRITDVSLQGNNTLQVAVGRRYLVQDKTGVYGGVGIVIPPRPFGDWELDIPHLEGVFARQTGWVSSNNTGTQRCSVANIDVAEPPYATGGQGGTFAGGEYWHGNNLYVPGIGTQEMMVVTSENPNKPSSGGPFYWVTQNQWYFSCLPTTAANNGVAGEGFLAIAPNGTKYWFNWIVSRPTPQITKAVGTPPIDPQSVSAVPNIEQVAPGLITPMAFSSVFLRRVEVSIYPTRVEDKFGNYVTYVYDATSPQRLTNISSSDGRTIALTYDPNGHVQTMVSGTRTWTYTYSGEVMTSATLPDQSKWVYTLGSLASVHAVQQDYTEPDYTCSRPPSKPVQSTYTGSITHPSGAVGTFSFKPLVHGRSYVDRACLWVAVDGGVQTYAFSPILYDAISIVEKRIEGPGIPTPLTWLFSYSLPSGSWAVDCPGSTCPSTKMVEVSGPNSGWMRYTFSNRFRQGEGKLVRTDIGTKAGTGTPTILRTDTQSYSFTTTGQPYPAHIGLSPYTRGDRTSETYAPLLQETKTQQSRVFSTTVNSYDAFARPVNVTRSSAPVP